MGFSRLLRCVYPDFVGAREGVALPHNLALKYFERICAPADLPPRQSYFASGGWNSLAYFVAFTPTLSGPVPTLVGAREDLAPAHPPLAQSLIASGGWNSLAYFVALERI